MAQSLKNRKKNLIKQSEKFKKALSGDLKEIKEHSVEIGKGALFFGGAVAIGYLLFKILKSTTEEEIETKNKTTEIVYVNAPNNNSVFSSIMNSITLFLLNIAKEKLYEYLNTKKSTDE